MKIEARLTFDRVRHDVDTDAHLVVSLTAPTSTRKRPRIFVMPVVDVSGSMAGDKMQYAKRSVLKLIDHLQDGDYCGLVLFDNRVSWVSPVAVSSETKEMLRAEVGKLGPGGSTNFSGGFLKAVELMHAMDLGADIIHRVIMFTDGYANCGVATTAPDLLKLLEANRGRISVSAFGYGVARDCDHDLLTAWAKEGMGNYAYIENPDAALAAFGKELGGLVSTYATDVELEVKPLSGHQIVDVVSDVDADEEMTGEVSVKIPDLLAEETRHLVFGVKLKQQKQALPRQVNVFDVEMTHNSLDEDGKNQRHRTSVKAKVQFVKQGEQQDLPTKEVDQIVALAQTVKAQLEAEAKAKAGDYDGARRLLQEHHGSARARGHVEIASFSAKLQGHFASSDSYQQGQGYLRSVGRGMTAGYGTYSADESANADLARLGVACCNASQAQLSEDFSAPDAVEPVQAPDASVAWAVTSGQTSDPPPAGEVPQESTNSAPVEEKKPILTKRRSSQRW